MAGLGILIHLLYLGTEVLILALEAVDLLVALVVLRIQLLYLRREIGFQLRSRDLLVFRRLNDLRSQLFLRLYLIVDRSIGLSQILLQLLDFRRIISKLCFKLTDHLFLLLFEVHHFFDVPLLHDPLGGLELIESLIKFCNLIAGFLNILLLLF